MDQHIVNPSDDSSLVSITKAKLEKHHLLIGLLALGNVAQFVIIAMALGQWFGGLLVLAVGIGGFVYITRDP